MKSGPHRLGGVVCDLPRSQGGPSRDYRPPAAVLATVLFGDAWAAVQAAVGAPVGPGAGGRGEPAAGGAGSPVGPDARGRAPPQPWPRPQPPGTGPPRPGPAAGEWAGCG